MRPGQVELDPQTRAFYVRTLAVLNEAKVPFLIGGAYAMSVYTGIERHTKDMDVFARRADRDQILRTLEGAGYRTEVPFPHWLAKAHGEGCFVDVIYSSGNSVAEVDDEWFEHALPGDLFGVPVRLCPPEEVLWSKSYVMERERFDGADVAHLLRARGDSLDWPRVLRRFGPHWRVLLGHLVLFGFIYPGERSKVPAQVVRELADRLRDEAETGPTDAAREAKVCGGTYLSREQYLDDIGKWGYKDARLKPPGRMTPEDVTNWTAAIDDR